MKLSVRLEEQQTSFRPETLIVAGFTGRDTEAVREHVDELKREGIPAPDSVPAYYHLPTSLLTTESSMSVYGNSTSGEVEPVLLIYEEDWYVGVGSDHTDRALESVSIPKSKAICPKVIHDRFWSYDRIRQRWDDFQLQSWSGENERPYQKARLNALLPPEEIVQPVRSYFEGRNGLLFLGTVPLLTDSFQYSSRFRGELTDPDGASLSVTYRVRNTRPSNPKESASNETGT